MPDMQRRAGWVDAGIKTNTLLSKQPVQLVAVTKNDMSKRQLALQDKANCRESNATHPTTSWISPLLSRCSMKLCRFPSLISFARRSQSSLASSILRICCCVIHLF